MRIVVVEDNKALAKGIAYRLRDAGHAVDLLHDGEDADAHIRTNGADLAVLDINLPGQDGLTLLRAMRARGDMTPVILLTARAETQDRVMGLDAGADDYLVKPFAMEELDARVRALVRRRPAMAATLQDAGPLQFDTAARQVLHEGEPLDIPRRELALFEALFGAQGRRLSKSALVDHLYGVGADVEESVVEVYISRLRKRLAPHGLRISAARGLGYMLELPE